jgi:hypothetical protein
MDIRVERAYDGVCTVFAPNLIVSGLSEEAAEALSLALDRSSREKTVTPSNNTKGGRAGQVASSSQPARQNSDRARSA